MKIPAPIHLLLAISPPSGPTQWLFQGPPTESKFLAAETKQQAKLMIFDYIETFYNKHRKHSSLGMKSPDQFETLLAKKTNHN